MCRQGTLISETGLHSHFDHVGSATTGFRCAAQSGMDGCCDPRGCDSMFGASYARERARRYRRRGLGVTERNIVTSSVVVVFKGPQS